MQWNAPELINLLLSFVKKSGAISNDPQGILRAINKQLTTFAPFQPNEMSKAIWLSIICELPIQEIVLTSETRI
jgi:hypothetical protein